MKNLEHRVLPPPFGAPRLSSSLPRPAYKPSAVLFHRLLLVIGCVSLLPDQSYHTVYAFQRISTISSQLLLNHHCHHHYHNYYVFGKRRSYSCSYDSVVSHQSKAGRGGTTTPSATWLSMAYGKNTNGKKSGGIYVSLVDGQSKDKHAINSTYKSRNSNNYKFASKGGGRISGSGGNTNSKFHGYLPDLTKQLQKRTQTTTNKNGNYRNKNCSKSNNNNDNIIPFVKGAVLTLVAIGLIIVLQHPIALDHAKQFVIHPKATLQSLVSFIDSMGNGGIAYFAAFYILAEILAIPATPLTASAGYLFGVKEGFVVVLASASVAASAAFWIGRTLLRDYVEGVIDESPKFKALDKAIGEEGFKLMLVLRLSPIFPFALSNYLYGASSVEFWPYFLGTLIGFIPGTLAYVYTGTVGKALTLDGASAEPWYVYAGVLTVALTILKYTTDIASRILEEVEAAEENAS